MEILDLGIVDYAEALKTQESKVSEVKSDPTKETIIVCQHPFVITVGRAIGAGEDVLDKSAPIFEVTRGGRSTLHAPGQIVIYPILNLQNRSLGLKEALRLLESAIIETLSELGIKSMRIEGKTGVWIPNGSGEKKIASLGIAVRQGVSYHGLALNVCNDLSLFEKLNPCGFSPQVMTSVKKELEDEIVKEDIDFDISDSDTETKDQTLLEDIKKRLLKNLKEFLGE